jgi:hypothetical protein
MAQRALRVLPSSLLFLLAVIKMENNRLNKQLLLLSLLALFPVSSSFGGERVLGTPVDRLIGHWSSDAGDNVYYAGIMSDGFGSYIIVQPNGNTAIHQYKLISQIPAGERVIVQIIFSSGNKQTDKYMISKDGVGLEYAHEILGRMITGQLKYVDDKISP